MPIDYPTAQLAVNTFDNASNAMAVAGQSKKARKWQEKMYAIQRQDALNDWNRVNDYNSPAAQMQRFKDAGLNPDLIYGQGSSGEAGQVRSSSPGSWQGEAPRFNYAPGIAEYYDVRLKEATLDNLRVDNTNKLLESALRTADIIGKGISNEKGIVSRDRMQFDLDMVHSLRENTMEVARENLRRLQIGNQFTLNEDERRASMNAANLTTAAERILSMRLDRAKTGDERRLIQQQIINLKKDAKLKQLDIDLRKMGINPNDPTWQRVLGRVVNGFSPARVGKMIKDIGDDIDWKDAGSTIDSTNAHIRQFFGIYH